MQRNTIKTVNNITEAISNLASGDIVFFNIDETLILTGYKKFSDAPRLTEPDLADTIMRLQERGIRVTGLTTRSTKKELETTEQLEVAGIKIPVIFAPDIQQADGSIISTKSGMLRHYLTMTEASYGKPKRIFVFDHSRAQLEIIATQCSDLPIPIFLKHYVTTAYQPVNVNRDTNAIFPEKLDGFVKLDALGGGTASVFSIGHPESDQRLVLKLGAHEDGAKVEMLCNTIYQLLGVDVPKMRVYHTLPKTLASSLNLQHPYRFAQVSEYIRAGRNTTTVQIKKIRTRTFRRPRFAG